jgi:chromate transport protein ChrA
MASKKPSKKPVQGDLMQLIEVIADALVKLITTGTSTIVALGILVILAIIILQAPSEIQQQIVPLLTGMLGVIIGRMLTSQETSPPKPPETPSSSV